ncbi:MAG: nucleotidyltransferase domain-containing protein [Magnetococcales bacterium]|nr:nucleotidyltransferase domain-containing protein [Magnetococcales bacterium]
MSTVSDEMLQAMARLIVEAVHPESVILFGSQARDEAGEDSDVDLLVITSESYGLNHSRRQTMVRLGRLLMDFPVSKDIVLFSRDEVEQWRTAKNHLIARALGEGRVLYERH